MANKIVYLIVFLIAFLFVTVSIILLNERYTNIFEFDFSVTDKKPVIVKKTKTDITQDLKTYITDELKGELLDSIYAIGGKPRVDTVYADVRKDPVFADSIKKINTKIQIIEQELISKNTEIQDLKALKKANRDSAYVKWKADMVKIYESMDSKAAARIIQNLEENLAKDILFSMKKKKAAEIIMKLNPETASRLTRME